MCRAWPPQGALRLRRLEQSGTRNVATGRVNGRKRPALKKILKEGREFGVGVILSTQFLKHFGASDDDYAKYIMTWVVHNVADLKQSDIEFVFKTGSKSDETQRLFDDIKKLEIHHSIVKIGTSKPCYIRDKAFWELYNEL